MSPPPPTLRPATLDDVAFLRAMIWEALLASPTFLARLGVETLRQHEDDYWARWPDQRDPAFVALDSAGRAVGAIVLKPDVEARPVTRWRLGMGVVADGRRAGVGRRLIEGAVDFARAEGAGELTLLVDPMNAPARALYRRAGFAEVGERSGVLEMRRVIADAASTG